MDNESIEILVKGYMAIIHLMGYLPSRYISRLRHHEHLQLISPRYHPHTSNVREGIENRDT